MLIEGTRFGRIVVDDDRLITIPRGLLGFADQRRFVLHEHRQSGPIAWFQSVDTPDLAFPVMDGLSLIEGYPEPSPAALAASVGLGADDVALLVLVTARATGVRLTANLLAPVIVDCRSRVGAQVVLDPQRWSSAHPIMSRPTSAPPRSLSNNPSNTNGASKRPESATSLEPPHERRIGG